MSEKLVTSGKHNFHSPKSISQWVTIFFSYKVYNHFSFSMSYFFFQLCIYFFLFSLGKFCFFILSFNWVFFFFLFHRICFVLFIPVYFIINRKIYTHSWGQAVNSSSKNMSSVENFSDEPKIWANNFFIDLIKNINSRKKNSKPFTKTKNPNFLVSIFTLLSSQRHASYGANGLIKLHVK